jgi:hypothetical protein
MLVSMLGIFMETANTRIVPVWANGSPVGALSDQGGISGDGKSSDSGVRLDSPFRPLN